MRAQFLAVSIAYTVFILGTVPSSSDLWNIIDNGKLIFSAASISTFGTKPSTPGALPTVNCFNLLQILSAVISKSCSKFKRSPVKNVFISGNLFSSK